MNRRLRRAMVHSCVIVLLASGAVVTGVEPAAASAVLCGDKTATIVGTDMGQQLDGTAGDDVIAGLGGGDIINGLGGNDTICGGDGNDVVSGGDGDDVILGGENNDSLTGDAGNDVVSGDNGDDVVSGGTGDDEVFGSDGRDSVRGDDGADIVVGGPGNDSLDGGTATDTCREDPTDSTVGCEHHETGAGERPGYTQLTSPLSDRVAAEVNPATGNLLLRSTDLSIVGTGLNFSVVRTWNSVATGFGAFGTNTTMGSGADVKLSFGAAGIVTYRGPSGYVATYTPDGSGGYAVPDNYQAADLAAAGTQWTLTVRNSSEKLTFDAAGKLLRDADRNGNANTFTYNADGTLGRVDDTQGRTTSFDYENGRVHSLTDPSGRHALYSYDGAGNLVQVTDATGAVWKFSYWEGNSNLNQIVDPRGNAETYGYDSNHRVVRATYAAYTTIAATTTYTYGRGTTSVTDPLGHRTTYAYDVDGRVVSVTDAVGNRRDSGFDPTGRVTSQTSPSAAVSNFTYRAGGQLASVQMPTETSDGGSTPGALTSIDYADTSHAYLPTQVTDPQGAQTRYTYNGNGNATTTSTFNADGSPTSTQNTSTKKYQGDDNGAVDCGAHPGQLCTSTTAAGNATSYGYDGRGNVVAITPPAPLGRTTLVVDSLSRVTSSTDGRGLMTTYSYDADDRLVSTSTQGRAVQYAYDRSGNLVTRREKAGSTKYTYDAAGHLVAKTVPGAKPRAYTYDLAGNLTSSGDRKGPAGITRYAYDAANECTSVTDPAGQITTITWTNARRTGVSYPGGVTQTVTYDAAGRPIRTTVTKGSTTYVDQSALYRSASGTDQTLLRAVSDLVAGTSTTYSYDGQNRLISATTSGSTPSEYRFVLDADSNRTQAVTNGVYSAIDGFNGADQLVSRGGAGFGGYDGDGNATSDGSGQSYVYGPTNQTTSITPPGSAAVTLAYLDTDQSERTAVGTSAGVWGALGLDQDTTAGQTTFYVRDPSGQLVSERSPGGTYYYLYDIRGSVVGLTDGGGNRVNTYAYDPYGNSTSSASAAPVANPWRWNAGYLDSATGLYHFSARYYDPRLGRFTQVDPSGQEPNAYLWGGADPINRSDPSGLVSAGYIGSACYDFICGELGVMADEGGNPHLVLGLSIGPEIGASVSAVFSGGSVSDGWSYSGGCIAGFFTGGYEAGPAGNGFFGGASLPYEEGCSVGGSYTF